LRQRSHLIIAIVLFTVIIVKPTISNISAFIEDIQNNRFDFSSIVPSPSSPEPVLALIVLIGAYFPDIDYIGFLRKWHRKLLHNIFAVGFATFIMSAYAGILFGGIFLLGYASHIIADSLTPTGTYLIWPINRKYKRGWKVSTGTREEDAAMILIVASIIGGYIAVMYLMHSL